MGIGLIDARLPEKTGPAGATGPFVETPAGPETETPTPTASPTPTAVAGPDRRATYIITNGARRLAADVAGGSRDDGAPVIMFEPHGRSNQQWNIRDTGDGFVLLVSVDSGKCLQIDDDSDDDGALAEVAECSGDAAQSWRFAENQDGWSLTSKQSRLVLDMSDDQIDGARRLVQQYPDEEARSQVWYFTPLR